MSKAKKSDPKKTLSKAFVDNHQNIAEDEAMELIYECEKTVKDLEEDRASNDRLNAAKQIVKDLEKGYSSAVNYERAKIDFLVEKIREIRGNEVNPTSGLQSDEDATA